MAEFYSNAAKIIDIVLHKKGTPKALVIENSRIENKKKLYALVCEAIKYKSVTDKLLEDTKLLAVEKQLKYPMAMVLVYDFMFGCGLQVGGRWKQAITRNKTSLQAALARMKVRAKVINSKDLLPQNILEQQELQIPRYVRVNTLKASTNEVITWFSKNTFMPERRKPMTVDSKMASRRLMADEHIPNVLVFPPGTDLHDNTLYKEGKIILQDKASCFPAFVLNPPAGSDVIDACAAPGMKTSQLVAIMGNKGKVFAFDISRNRISTMKKLLKGTGERIVETKHADFLKSDPGDPLYKNVEYILVDPSCSGSGMTNRLDYVTNNADNMDAKEKQRVFSLAHFQENILCHALSFPNVKKVVYSTCSIHDMENEEVVMKCIEKFHDKFELKMALPDWQHRGHAVFPEASKCVRASQKEGSTSGFFLALFEARESRKICKAVNHQENGENNISNGHIKSISRKHDHSSSAKTKETLETKGMDDCISTNHETYPKKRKRSFCIDIRDTSQRTKHNKPFVLTRTYISKKCSNKEFENRLKLLKRRQRSLKAIKM